MPEKIEKPAKRTSQPQDTARKRQEVDEANDQQSGTSQAQKGDGRRPDQSGVRSSYSKK